MSIYLFKCLKNIF